MIADRPLNDSTCSSPAVSSTSPSSASQTAGQTKEESAADVRLGEEKLTDDGVSVTKAPSDDPSSSVDPVKVGEPTLLIKKQEDHGAGDDEDEDDAGGSTSSSSGSVSVTAAETAEQAGGGGQGVINATMTNDDAAGSSHPETEGEGTKEQADGVEEEESVPGTNGVAVGEEEEKPVESTTSEAVIEKTTEEEPIEAEYSSPIEKRAEEPLVPVVVQENHHDGGGENGEKKMNDSPGVVPSSSMNGVHNESSKMNENSHHSTSSHSSAVLDPAAALASLSATAAAAADAPVIDGASPHPLAMSNHHTRPPPHPHQQHHSRPHVPTASDSFMCPTSGTTTSLLIEPHVAVRVIKGEIHNVLSVMRNSNQKYISPQRFTEEIHDETHPIIHQFQELHFALSEWDLRVESHYQNHLNAITADVVGERPPPPCTPDALLYLPPFCAAVQGREISAPVTGAALSALHKFLLYGFIHPHALHASAGMTMIAQALLHCTFEESSSANLSSSHHDAGPGDHVVSVAAVATATSVPPSSDGGKHHHHRKSRRDSTGGGGLASSTSSRSVSGSRHGHNLHYTSRADDEQVVLKLLDLAAMVVRCSFLDSIDLISSDRVVGLLDTCLHVSHIAKSASPLLRSAAADALAQIVLQVFAGQGQPVVEARQEILAKLASLLNPATHSEDVIISSLTAVNIALETCREELTPREIAILQNDLCKYLLQWSATHDLLILSLTLRVIFNLFQTIRNHLKVPLEVFLTSVHLRILEIHYQASTSPKALPSSSTDPGQEGAAAAAAADTSVTNAVMMMSLSIPEEREVALESLLEFCQEPSLMQDIYLNYDCDVACTNLYESVVTTLGKNCMPMDWKGIAGCRTLTATGSTDYIPVTTPTGVTADAAPTTGGSRRTPVVSEAHYQQQQQLQPSPPQLAVVVSTGGPSSAPTTIPLPLNHLNRLALEGMLAILSSIARRVHNDISIVNGTANHMHINGGSGINSNSNNGNNLNGLASPASLHSMASSISDDGMASSTTTGGAVSDDELHLRRRKKTALAQVAQLFNKDPMGREWIEAAVEEQILDSTESAAGVAELLYTAPGIDKVKSGEYLSKGPVTDYPFQADVRNHFVCLYDFSDLTFAAALRLFLTKFRLPGEAQCIDRFMECFSTELYRQQGQSSIFKNADAVYVMSFSTIMLNTDLHNPTIKEENRMTLDQFIRNNRGINGGEDMPLDFLTELYEQIKAHQIQVQLEVGEFLKKQELDDFRTAWDSILSKHKDVATPFFTPAHMARRSIVRANVHDKEMFLVMARWALRCLPAVFMRSWDDGVVLKALKGLKQVAMIADYFGIEETVNDVLQILLSIGRDYCVNCIMLDHSNVGAGMNRSVASISESDEGDETTVGEGDQETPIPYSLLSSGKGYSEVDISGAAGHRGLLALDTGFVLVRKYARQVKTAWPNFIECLCVLRDARALPAGLSDLDDFADSNGNVLPQSPYAKASQRRLDDFYRTKSDPESEKKQSWFQTFFKKNRDSEEDDDMDMDEDISIAPERIEMSSSTKAVLAVAEAADVEHVVQMGSTKLPSAAEIIESLMEVVDEYPFEDDPVAEQHAIFSLELAARALLSNRDRAAELFPLFLIKFESIFGRVTTKTIPSPFVIERIVVTILRCSIHLYDIPELRPNLRVSLHLPLMSIPKTFLRDIADRMACGLAIILRASFHQFASANEWVFMGDTLDMLANYGSARVFVFDGIASTVEYAVPQYGDNKSGSSGEDEDEIEDPDRPTLGKEACGALSRVLIRFVLGFYRADTTLAVPAMVCLEKLYRRMTAILISEMEEKPKDKDLKHLVPNKDLWQNVAVAVYSVCRSPDPETSRHGYECCQRIILRTPVKQIPHEKWIAMLYLILSKQPPTGSHLSRANTFVLLGNLMMRVSPALSRREENRDDLTDLIHQMANLAQENFRHGRRGRVSPLFEKTVQTVTYLSNHMQTDDWKGDPEFGKWAGEILLAELEKVGAAGAALKNQAAVKKREGESAEAYKV